MFFHWIEFANQSYLLVLNLFNRGVLSCKFKFILSEAEEYLLQESLKEDLAVCSITDRCIKSETKVLQIKTRNKTHILTVRIINL